MSYCESLVPYWILSPILVSAGPLLFAQMYDNTEWILLAEELSVFDKPCLHNLDF